MSSTNHRTSKTSAVKKTTEQLQNNHTASSTSNGGHVDLSKSRNHSSASANYVDPENVAKLESITGLSRSQAMNLLEAANNKLDKAIDLHFGNQTSSASTHTSKTSSFSSFVNQQSTKNGNKRPIYDDDNASNSSSSSSNSTNRMMDDDNVRAPLERKIDRLIDYDPYGETLFYVR